MKSHDRDGITRAIYVTAVWRTGRRRRCFREEDAEDAGRALEIARERAKEVR
jgi:hypothetical protein